MSLSTHNTVRSNRYLLPFILITSLFFMWGFARSILDVLNKHFQQEMDISVSQSTLIQAATYIAYALMALPAGIFITRYGYRKGVVFGLILFGAGSLAFIPGDMWYPFMQERREYSEEISRIRHTGDKRGYS